MLSNERINEAKANITRYLDERLIAKQAFNKIVYDTYVRNYKESLELAENTFTNKMSNLWVIVISYYSMFYIANAVLYKLGYKVGSKIAHKVTADALIVYIKNKLTSNLLEDYEIANEEAMAISDNIMQNFDLERLKRSKFQYETTEEIKQGKAETSLNRAKEFIAEMEKLLR
ncbi:HEPN domain-containing protein [Candidatus Woesearchaeota archaeon]|nr:HEPN domain-containing protein [Candidatus Woesearchaeota archaeon]